MAGCDAAFTTTNYGVTTTPRAEYAIAAGLRECPPADRLDRCGRVVRVPRRVEELRELGLCRAAGLTDDEILAVVRSRRRRRRCRRGF